MRDRRASRPNYSLACGYDGEFQQTVRLLLFSEEQFAVGIVTGSDAVSMAAPIYRVSE